MRLLTAKQFMDAALEEDGYSLVFDSEAQAKRMRLACYQARSRQRRVNDRVYIDEMEYISHSEYDALTFTITPSGDYWLLTAHQVDLYMEHTMHGAITPEQLQQLKDGTLRVDELLPVDKASPAPMDEVSSGMDSPSDIQDD
jgi:hypothetical protein